MPVTIQGTIPYPPNANAAPITQLANDLQRMCKSLSSSAGNINQTAQAASGSWTGAAAQAFMQHLQGRAATVQGTAKLLQGAIAPLRTFAAAITSTSAMYTAAATAEQVARAGLPYTAAALAAAIAQEGAAVAAHQAAGAACGAAIGIIDVSIAAQALKKIFGDDDGGSDDSAKARAEAEMRATFAKAGLDENGKPLPGSELSKLLGSADTVPALSAGTTTPYEQSLTPSVAGSVDTLPMNGGASARYQTTEMPKTDGMNDAEKFSTYAAYFKAQGVDITKLPSGQAAILGLRQETPTTWDRGTGRFDDRIVVVSQTDTPAGKRFAVHEYRANTEPSAQYDAKLGGSVVNGVRINNRANNGVDANGDGVIDSGRIPEGSYTFERSTSTAGGHRVAQPTLRVVGDVMAERDVNHDGLFNAADGGARASAGRTMVFHRGSPANTFSAGCQTFYDDATYKAFYQSLPKGQQRFTYVVHQVGKDL